VAKRVILFLIDDQAWSGVVDWSDEEERERLTEVTERGYWDAPERKFIPARSIISAQVCEEAEDFFDE
jgi:hypothetical protein